MMMRLYLLLLLASTNAFQISQPINRRSTIRLYASDKNSSITFSEEELLAQLQEYIEVREKAVGSRNASVKNNKKRKGGSRGNFFLEFTSTAPNVIEEDEEKYPLDYDELTKYGYQNLVKPIMQSNGGRLGWYEKLGLTPPPTPDRLRPKPARKLVIDREGDLNPKRYTGLKMGQALFDDQMGDALMSSLNRKELTSTDINEEDEFKVPFSDLPKSKYKPTADYTPEMIDEESRRRGAAISWAKRQKELNKIPKDSAEKLDLDGSLRIFCSMTVLTSAVAFGHSTPHVIDALGVGGNQEMFHAPAIALSLSAIGSGLVGGLVLAPSLNRNKVVWGIKGLLGGPAAILQLRQLESLPSKEQVQQ